MRKSPMPRGRLAIERLEDRSTPAVGVPWIDSTSLSLSFVPDGTDISGTPSSTTSYFGATPPSVWQKEMLRAFQTWAVQANINVGLTTDGGQAMGVAGAPQEDPRFGDFRIGARRLSSNFNDSVAGNIPFSYAGGTWAGDIILNTRYTTAVNGTGTNQYDLYTVMLQEAGNALGVLDNPNDKTSVMYPSYQGAVTGLGSSDVTDIRALYGARKADKYEGPTGNGTIATAYNLTANGNLTAVSGDVTQAGDADVYKFTTPPAGTGVTGLTVQLKDAGLSLFTGKVTVYDANQNAVGTAVTTNPLSNDVSVTVANYQPGATYFARVEGAGADVFSVGGYNLQLAYNQPVGASAISSFVPYINYEGWSTNGVLSTSQPLDPLSAAHASTFAVGGLLTAADDVDWFKFTPSADVSGTLTLSVWAYNGSPVLPAVSVYDSLGNLIPTQVITNDHGLFTIQAANRQAGGTYYAKVSAADPAGAQATGLYVLGADLGVHPPTLYDSLSNGSLSSSQTVSYATLTVGEGRLMQFSLSASSAGGQQAAVRMSIYDSQGNRVFTLVAEAGKGVKTGTVWLESGTYTVVYNASAKSGASLAGIAFSVAKWERSGPIDPYPIGGDPTSPPPPPPPTGGQVVTTDPAPLPGPIGPVTDPYANG